jgi:hypothetical protein
LGANLTVLAEIKDLAFKTKILKGEKKAKPIRANFQINPVENNDEDIDALKYGKNRGGL